MAGFADRIANLKAKQDAKTTERAATDAAEQSAREQEAKKGELHEQRAQVARELEAAQKEAEEGEKAIADADAFAAEQGDALDAEVKAEMEALKAEAAEAKQKFEELQARLQGLDAEITAVDAPVAVVEAPIEMGQEEKQPDPKVEESVDARFARAKDEMFLTAFDEIDAAAMIPDEWKVLIKEALGSKKEMLTQGNQREMLGDFSGLTLTALLHPDYEKAERDSQEAEAEYRRAENLAQGRAAYPGSEVWFSALPKKLRDQFPSPPGGMRFEDMAREYEAFIKRTEKMLPELKQRATELEEARRSQAAELQKDQTLQAAGMEWRKIRRQLTKKLDELQQG